jgi:3-oxoacyl-ACP reductase-like protein
MPPQEQHPMIARLDAVQSQFDAVQRDINLDEIRSELNDVERVVAKLPEEIARARARGYVFAAYLEHKAEVVSRRWGALRDDLQRQLQRESSQSRMRVEAVRERFEKATPYRAKPTALDMFVPDIEREVTLIRGQIDAALNRLREVYADVKRDANQAMTQLSSIHWYLDQLDEASFKLLAGESLYLAAQAEHQVTGRGGQDPDGILYLTDQRLIFEQKETTGKKLGLFGGKKVQEVEWEIPLHKIESVKAENKGLFGGKDLLQFGFKSGAPFAQAQIEVKGGVQSKLWATQIERMISGGANDERAIQPDAETLEAMRSAPTACPMCGATLPQLVANQLQIECEYCGTVIRV